MKYKTAIQLFVIVAAVIVCWQTDALQQLEKEISAWVNAQPGQSCWFETIQNVLQRFVS